MPFIKLNKSNTQKDDNKQYKAFNLDRTRYGPLKHEAGNDINKNRQWHE